MLITIPIRSSCHFVEVGTAYRHTSRTRSNHLRSDSALPHMPGNRKRTGRHPWASRQRCADRNLGRSTDIHAGM